VNRKKNEENRKEKKNRNKETRKIEYLDRRRHSKTIRPPSVHQVYTGTREVFRILGRRQRRPQHPQFGSHWLRRLWQISGLVLDLKSSMGEPKP
jgi:hypothetical protein